jgi:carbamoyltransferase
MTSYIVGLSAYYHDSAVALLADGEIVSAAQEERFTRIKQDRNFPANALEFCLKRANISLEDVETIFYYENPKKKLNRIISTYLNFGVKGYKSFVSEMPAWIFEKVHVKRTLSRELARQFGAGCKQPPIEYIDHHVSHAAAAFFPSPFSRSAVLCVDGVGEWATTSAWVGDGNAISPVWDIEFPHSLGLLYSAITYFCGFKVDSGEYKLMGLAPYGEPRYFQTMCDHLIDIKPDGSFWLNMEYFDYAVGDSMINEKFEKLFGGPRRKPEALITGREFDLAASIQLVLEHALLRLAKSVKVQTGQKALCLAGAQTRRRTLSEQEQELDGIELLKCIRSTIPAVSLTLHLKPCWSDRGPFSHSAGRPCTSEVGRKIESEWIVKFHGGCMKRPTD